MNSILGKKIRMTQFYDDDLHVVPVTIIQAGPCHVLQVKTSAARTRDAVNRGSRKGKRASGVKTTDGYDAVQLGFDDARKADQATTGHAKKAGVEPKRFVREFRVGSDESYEAGQEITVDVLDDVTRVDVSATSKGRGFQGTIKRHGFSRGPMTHGSKNKREPGSTGMAAYPARILKGKRMAGQMGNKHVTTKHLEVVKIDKEQNLLFVRGAVPGAHGGYVVIRPSKLPANKAKA